MTCNHDHNNRYDCDHDRHDHYNYRLTFDDHDDYRLTFDVVNPYSEALIESVANCGAAETDLAIGKVIFYILIFFIILTMMMISKVISFYDHSDNHNIGCFEINFDFNFNDNVF